MTQRLPIVALVGRQNVGKSTLLNTLVGSRRAIVSPIAGTTRDPTTARCAWRGRSWTIVDTGGIEETPDDELRKGVRRLAEHAAATADAVCFVVDGKLGLTREDRAVAATLRRLRAPVVLVVNKLDGPRHRANMPQEILRLGFPVIVPISAKNGSGTGDLLDRIASILPGGRSVPAQQPITLLLVGRTNVGKSSLLNRLAGSERVLVARSPHTTRDPQEVLLTRSGVRFLVTDTAGVRAQRRRARGRETDVDVAAASVERTFARFATADVAAVIMDVQQPVTSLERLILNHALRSRLSILLVVNKWDLVREKTAQSPRAYETMLRRELPFLGSTPLLFVSAATGQRVASLLDTAQRLAAARRRTLSPQTLQSFVDRVIAPRWPQRRRGGRVRELFSLTQMPGIPPTFRVQIGPKQKLPTAYKQFIANALRDQFDFGGTPVRLIIEQKLRR